MHSSRVRFRLTAAAAILALAACSKGSQTSGTTTTESATVAPAAVATATTDSPTPVAVPSAVAVVPSASPTAAALASVTFTDISGVDGADAIRQLAFLGVLDSTSGQFRPHDPLTRADYVRWLVKANNAYFASQPAKRIRLAETSAPSFVDVPAGQADYRYIQGMSDAGYVIGVDKTHFAPARNLTREELVAILISRDNGGAAMPASKPPSAWNYSSGGGSLPVDLVDRDKVSKPYWPAFQVNDGYGNSYAVGVLHRVYGTVKVFHPQQLATRADAAIALQEIDRTNAANLVPKT